MFCWFRRKEKLPEYSQPEKKADPIRRFHIAYIDPELDAGSFVGYRVYDYEYANKPYIQVNLGDCHRTIGWDIQNGPAGIRKVQNVIEVLNKLIKEMEELKLDVE